MNRKENLQNNDNESRKEYWLRLLRFTIIVLGVLAMLAFWGTFAYAMWSGNVALAMGFAQVIIAAVAVFGTVHFLQKLVQTIRNTKS